MLPDALKENLEVVGVQSALGKVTPGEGQLGGAQGSLAQLGRGMRG